MPKVKQTEILEEYDDSHWLPKNRKIKKVTSTVGVRVDGWEFGPLFIHMPDDMAPQKFKLSTFHGVRIIGGLPRIECCKIGDELNNSCGLSLTEELEADELKEKLEEEKPWVKHWLLYCNEVNKFVTPEPFKKGKKYAKFDED